VTLLSDDRPHGLGGRIDIQIELTSRADIEVRAARVDLVCEEHYVESYTVEVPIGSRADAGGSAGMTGVYIPPKIPKLVHKDVKESYVHSSEVFLTNVLLQSGTANRYNVRLMIDSEPPPHTGNATVKWRLELVVDVARARDIKARYKVNILLPERSRKRNWTHVILLGKTLCWM
jgi:hypothetical protein